MTAAERDPAILDVRDLPTAGLGSHGIVWWGVLGFIAVEATMLALCVAAYFYLRSQAAAWPAASPLPALAAPTLTTAVMLASLGPMIWTERAALALDQRRVRIGLLVCIAFGIAFTALRVLDFAALQVRWDTDAYGSIVWTMLGLHTAHLGAEVVETVVIAALMFRTGPIHPKYFSDVEDNALYWYFIVAVWLPIYAVVFLSPRVLA